MIGYIFLVTSAILTITICMKKVYELEKLEDVVELTKTQNNRIVGYFTISGIMYFVVINGIYNILNLIHN